SLPRIEPETSAKSPRRLNSRIGISGACPMSSTIPLIEEIAGWNLSGDVDRHRIALPVPDQRCFAQISVHELLDEFIAAELEELDVRFDTTIERHRDLPRPREHVGVFDRHLVPDDVGRHHGVALDEL